LLGFIDGLIDGIDMGISSLTLGFYHELGVYNLMDVLDIWIATGDLKT